MCKILGFIVVAFWFSLRISQAQANELADSTVYTLGFSTYLSHTDKYASGFDIYTDNEGYTYISGNTRDKNFPATKGAYQTELKGEADAFVVKYTPEGEIVFATLIVHASYFIFTPMKMGISVLLQKQVSVQKQG